MQCKQYIGYLHQQLVQYHNNVLCNGLEMLNHQSIPVQVPVDDSAATAAPASSAGTPG
jgi:hypothetical protein